MVHLQAQHRKYHYKQGCGVAMSIHGAKALKAARTNLGIGRVATKYGAKKTPCGVIEHGLHASKKEAARCQELRLLERGGEIEDLENQPTFPLQRN
jgi:hypothetical protein